MSRLHVFQTTEEDQLACPTQLVDQSMFTPALRFLTDFEKVQPHVVDASISALEVKQIMARSHLKMMFVVDEKSQCIGVVTSRQLSDRKFVKLISQGFDRHEVSVTEMMIPKHALHAFDFHELETAEIGDVLAAMKESGERYALVLERESHQIRGIFCADELERGLKTTQVFHNRPALYHLMTASL
ncbi:MAG: hypothetical protein CMD81_12505 [Gammaproteobacteria bacterium]|nr:hypothetical protein [Gammaproteobacteria bacterium]HBF10116.1 hypothetical protein [Gammaproteobacteria bacterium]|tara:strand:+ start:136 stop:693 length:558 start_codon:yes stop_codon:yes gene_type:complete